MLIEPIFYQVLVISLITVVQEEIQLYFQDRRKALLSRMTVKYSLGSIFFIMALWAGPASTESSNGAG